MRRNQWRYGAIALVGVGLALAVQRHFVHADGIPATDPLVYAGELDQSGRPATGSHQIGVQLWSAAVGGSAYCDVNTATLTLTDGTFRIPLATNCTAAIRSHADVWIEVTADSMPLPRTKLTAAPYAIEAARASDATGPLRSEIDRLQTASVPSGSIVAFAGTTAPPGWMLCDGSAVSRTTNAALFAAIGTAFGPGDGVNTFNVPDLRGRVPVGQGTHAEVNALGDSDGLALASRRMSHRHTVADPGHGHTARDTGHSHGINDPGHAHGIHGYYTGGPGGFAAVAARWDGTNPDVGGCEGATTGISIQNGTANVVVTNGTTGISVGPAGAPQDLVPFDVVNYIIRQ